jgi:hypothetical protein
MDGRGRVLPEKERRGATERLAMTVPVVRRHGLPRQPGARRLGGSRFGSDFVAPARGLSPRAARV